MSKTKATKSAWLRVPGGHVYVGIDIDSRWSVHRAWGFREVQAGRVFVGWTTSKSMPAAERKAA